MYNYVVLSNSQNILRKWMQTTTCNLQASHEVREQKRRNEVISKEYLPISNPPISSTWFAWFGKL